MSDFRVALGYRGSLVESCEARSAKGSVTLDERGDLYAAALGESEILCKDGRRFWVDVRRPAKIEIVVYGEPDANEAHYVYTHVLDAAGHLLRSDDRFQWSARNAEIRNGTCDDRSPQPGCISDSTAATLVPSLPSTTIEVRYAGVSASRTLNVRRAPAREPR